jgi:hypothetical protein
MLYSLSYTQNRRKERRLFYADTDEEALRRVREYAETHELLEEHIRVEYHPKGFYLERTLFPRIIPAEQKKKKKEG